jgi:hypothetical protein
MKKKKEVSRQRRWQIRKSQQGLCCGCGGPVDKGVHCEECRLKKRACCRQRNNYGQDVPLDKVIHPGKGGYPKSIKKSVLRLKKDNPKWSRRKIHRNLVVGENEDKPATTTIYRWLNDQKTKTPA